MTEGDAKIDAKIFMNFEIRLTPASGRCCPAENSFYENWKIAELADCFSKPFKPLFLLDTFCRLQAKARWGLLCMKKENVTKTLEKGSKRFQQRRSKKHPTLIVIFL